MIPWDHDDRLVLSQNAIIDLTAAGIIPLAYVTGENEEVEVLRIYPIEEGVDAIMPEVSVEVRAVEDTEGRLINL
jgi:hypothetical protein